MKIRAIKLREAHNRSCGGGGGNSFCSILWDQQAKHIVTASSSDTSICIHDPLFPSLSPKILRNHRDGVTTLALSPNSTCLASGSIDHSVKLYKFPGGEFETNITRFTLPIRTLAFNKSGTMLAAAGDDEGIKLINTIDGSIARVLKGHKGSISGIAFDPKSEYLASVDSIGTVIHWELQSGRTIQTLKGIAPDSASDPFIVNTLCWSPDGDLLAIPGLRNDVVIYDRDTLEKLFSLRADHVQPICFLCWSPNGKYMATSGLDKQVLIWDVDKKQDIDRQKFNDRICSMAWKPRGNALAVIDVMGNYGVWEPAVPSSMKSPTEDIPVVRSNGLLFFDEEEDEEEEEPFPTGSLSDLGEDSIGEPEPTSRKRLRKQSTDDWEEDGNNDMDVVPKVESRKKASISSKKDTVNHGKDALKSTIFSGSVKMQEPFQPGATPAQPGKRQFLCYNMLGCVTAMDHDGYSHIEIEFHDTGSSPRVPAMTDYFGFTMASLSETGSVFANPCKGEKNMSTLMFRPFSSWASNSEWSMRLEEEEVKAVALGNTWVAAATSLNFLRIFTEGGLQRYIISLDGPVVTLAGLKDELAVVTHCSPSLPSEEQMLEFRVLNISTATQQFRGRLPLTPGSRLTWFGFSEEGHLSAFDSKGLLRVFTNQYGGSWLPLFRASKLKKSDENYWVVGLNANKLFCVVCKSPDLFPQATPKPVLTLLDLSFPLATSDLGAESLENEFIVTNMHLSQIQNRLEAAAGVGEDTSSLDDEAFNTETALDRCILRLIASCCNGDKLVRATELVQLLTLEKSVKGAIKLVTALKLPNLAERFSTILEERLMNERLGTTTEADIANSTSRPGETSKQEELGYTFQRPSLPQRETVKEPSNAEKVITEQSLKSEKMVEHDGAVEVRKGKGATSLGLGKKAPEEILDQKSAAVKNGRETTNLGSAKKASEEDDPVISQRPPNPFAKKSNLPETSSLLDSLKKMKKIDTTVKR